MNLRILATVLTLAFSTGTSATTLTFDDLIENQLVGASYEASGFRLTGTSYWSDYQDPEAQFRAGNYPAVTGTTSVGLFMGGPGSKITLASSTGALFDISSIDLDESYSYQYGISEPVFFTGTKDDGEKIYTRYVFTNGDPRGERFLFDEKFHGLRSLEWAQGAIGHTFDNISVTLTSDVPEPSTAWLCLLTLAGLLLCRRRRIV